MSNGVVPIEYAMVDFLEPTKFAGCPTAKKEAEWDNLLSGKHMELPLNPDIHCWENVTDTRDQSGSSASQRTKRQDSYMILLLIVATLVTMPLKLISFISCIAWLSTRGGVFGKGYTDNAQASTQEASLAPSFYRY